MRSLLGALQSLLAYTELGALDAIELLLHAIARRDEQVPRLRVTLDGGDEFLVPGRAMDVARPGTVGRFFAHSDYVSFLFVGTIRVRVSRFDAIAKVHQVLASLHELIARRNEPVPRLRVTIGGGDEFLVTGRAIDVARPGTVGRFFAHSDYVSFLFVGTLQVRESRIDAIAKVRQVLASLLELGDAGICSLHSQTCLFFQFVKR
jgi:hypothetical protein